MKLREVRLRSYLQHREKRNQVRYSWDAELFAIRLGVVKAISFDIKRIIIITDSLTAARRAVDASVHSGQAHSLAIVQALRGFFTNHPDRSIHFWDCPSKAQWSLHFLAHEDATSTKIAARCHPATSLDALQSKSAAACLDAWRTSFALPSSQGHHFLPLKGSIKNLLQPSYAKDGGWLPFIGKSVTLYARATRAILNHAPIGEFRQHFFPAECTQCPCGHYQVETHRYEGLFWLIRSSCPPLAHNITSLLSNT